MSKWKAQNIENAENIGILELENGEYFHVVKTDTHLVFGGVCNVGLLESGNMKIDTDFSLDENLQTLLEELEVYYADGPSYCSFIACNDRM